MSGTGFLKFDESAPLSPASADDPRLSNAALLPASSNHTATHVKPCWIRPAEPGSAVIHQNR